MKKRRTAEQVARVLHDVDHDLAKGLIVSGACRKIGIAENTYYRWRERHDPAVVDADRRCRELERLERLVAELMLDKLMLQPCFFAEHARCRSGFSWNGPLPPGRGRSRMLDAGASNPCDESDRDHRSPRGSASRSRDLEAHPITPRHHLFSARDESFHALESGK